jgi:hypothetical protein
MASSHSFTRLEPPAADSTAPPPKLSARTAVEQPAPCSETRGHVAGGVVNLHGRHAHLAREVARLVLFVQADADQISVKVQHVVETRHLPCDLVRNCEALQDYGSRLLVHVAQIIRRCEGKQ